MFLRANGRGLIGLQVPSKVMQSCIFLNVFCSACYLLHADVLLTSLFDLEDGGNMFLRIIGRITGLDSVIFQKMELSRIYKVH
jgi:hypothetical protein